MAKSKIMLNCSKCQRTKLIDEFRRRPGRSENGARKGRWSHCRDCEREYHLSPRGRELQNKRMRKFIRRLRKNDPAAYRLRNRKHNLKRIWGMSLEEYNQMLVAQNGRCAICEKKPKPGTNLFVDHYHKTGNIRGLLCHDCNIALGNFRDSVRRLKAAIQYVRKHKETITVPIS